MWNRRPQRPHIQPLSYEMVGVFDGVQKSRIPLSLGYSLWYNSFRHNILYTGVFDDLVEFDP